MKSLSFDLWEEKILLVALYWILYGGVLAIYTFTPYYRSLLDLTFSSFRFSPQMLLLLLLCGFSFFLLITKTRPGVLQRSRIYSTLQGILKLARALVSGSLRPSLSQEEMVSLALFLVKFFFVPIMLKFFIENFQDVLSSYRTATLFIDFTTPEIIFTVLYPLIFAIFLLIDTSYFLFGYLFESAALGSKVRSVDLTFLGWASTLACYPPFNDITVQFLGWHSTDFADFGSVSTNLIVGGMALVLMGVYVWATVSLGFKCSNLTNRGIVSSGAYAWLRHPAYSAKNIVWWIMGMPLVLTALFGSTTKLSSLGWSVAAAEEMLLRLTPLLSLFSWSLVYYMRALTEERHLMNDPEYRIYMKKVPNRFLPRFFKI